MNRRSFLSSILALGAAPAIVRADSLMRIVPREALVEVPGSLYARATFAADDTYVLVVSPSDYARWQDEMNRSARLHVEIVRDLFHTLAQGT